MISLEEKWIVVDAELDRMMREGAAVLERFAEDLAGGRHDRHLWREGDQLAPEIAKTLLDAHNTLTTGDADDWQNRGSVARPTPQLLVQMYWAARVVSHAGACEAFVRDPARERPRAEGSPTVVLATTARERGTPQMIFYNMQMLLQTISTELTSAVPGWDAVSGASVSRSPARPAAVRASQVAASRSR